MLHGGTDSKGGVQLKEQLPHPEKKLRVAVWRIQFSFDALVLQTAGYPVLMRPSPCREIAMFILEDSALTHGPATGRRNNDFAEWCDTVLLWYGFLLEVGQHSKSAFPAVVANFSALAWDLASLDSSSSQSAMSWLTLVTMRFCSARGGNGNGSEFTIA